MIITYDKNAKVLYMTRIHACISSRMPYTTCICVFTRKVNSNTCHCEVIQWFCHVHDVYNALYMYALYVYSQNMKIIII